VNSVVDFFHSSNMSSSSEAVNVAAAAKIFANELSGCMLHLPRAGPTFELCMKAYCEGPDFKFPPAAPTALAVHWKTVDDAGKNLDGIIKFPLEWDASNCFGATEGQRAGYILTMVSVSGDAGSPTATFCRSRRNKWHRVAEGKRKDVEWTDVTDAQANLLVYVRASDRLRTPQRIPEGPHRLAPDTQPAAA
jgi:hypothetical protein